MKKWIRMHIVIKCDRCTKGPKAYWGQGKYEPYYSKAI